MTPLSRKYRFDTALQVIPVAMRHAREHIANPGGIAPTRQPSYNLAMRFFALRLLAATLMAMLISSCARHTARTSTGVLPPSLARLHPSGPRADLTMMAGAGSTARPTASHTGPEPSAVVLREEAEADDDAEQGPGEAEEYIRMMRMPLGGPLQPERYLAARRHAESMRHYSIASRRFVNNRGGLKAESLSPALGVTGGWTSIGPGNVGGRTRSLVINPKNPNIMYAGSVSGGIWKTVDGGLAWTSLTDLVPTDYIDTLVMDPTDPNILYAGTGEGFFNGDARRGFGILKTTDGGANWTRLTATANSNFYYVTKIVITPSGHLYASTWTGVYQSLDAGNTWTRKLNQSFCLELVNRPDTMQDYLFATCSTTNSSNGQNAIFRNTDTAGAGTWDNVFSATNMGRTSLAIAPSQPTTIYAMSYSTNPQPMNMTGLIGVFRSQSSGDPGSWTTQTSNKDSNRLNTALLTNPSGLFSDVCSNGSPSYGGQGWYDNVLAVDPVNPDRVWAGGIDIFRSDDGGANWGLASYWNRSPGTEYAHADRHAIVFHPGYDGAANQTLFLGTDGGLFRTDNANAAVQTGPRAECSPNKSDIVWINLNNHYAVTQFYYGQPYPGGAAYMGGTQDNGTPRGTDAAGTEGFGYVFGGDGGWVAIDPIDPNTIYYEYVNSATYRSVNGGANTLDATHGINEPSGNFAFLKNIAMDPTDPQRLYVGGKTLWRTIDGGRSWTEASAPVKNTISAITVSPTDPNTVMFSDTSGAINYSNNALRSERSTVWAASTPRTPGTAAAIAFDPGNSGIVYAVYPAFKIADSDNHVYKSTDGGQSWTGIDGSGDTGIPDVPVNAIIVDPKNTQTIYIGSDLGIFVSIDGGATWARDVNPFVNAPVTSLKLERGSGVTWLFAFTYGRSAWKTRIDDGGTACSYSLDQGSLSLPAGGGSGSVNLMTAPGCAWSAVSADNVIVPQSPAGGTGPGTIYFNASANILGNPRKSALAVQGQAFTINQDAADTVSTNDEIDSAEPITSLPYAAAIGSNYTENASDPVHSCSGSRDFNTAWFKFTAPTDGTIQLRHYYPTVLAVYRQAADGGLGTEYICYSAASNVLFVNFNIPVTAGQVLFIESSLHDANAIARALTITMLDPSGVLVSVNSDKNTIDPGGQAKLTATVKGTSNTAVRWTISPPIGKISPDGIYTAPALIPTSAVVLATATAFADNTTQASVLLKLNGQQPAAATVAAVQNAASYQSGAVSPGEIVVIYGSGFGPADLAGISLTSNNNFVDSLTGNTRVFFDGIAAPMIYAASGQVSAVVPYEVSNRPTTVMEVKAGDTYSAAFPIAVASTAPGLFLADPGNSTQLALFNEDGTLNSADNPAAKGSKVYCYGTGEGATTPPSTNGQLNTKTFPRPVQSGTLRVGGQIAAISYFAAAPTFVAGVFQLNFTVPAAAPSGAAVPVVLTVGGKSSQSNATMAIQ